MFDSKTDKSLAPDTKSISDPVAGLDTVKGHGDKVALLDALVAEGKLSAQPFQGPQAILKEGAVSVGEIVQHSITGAKTSEIEAVKALPNDMKIALMERVLEERPNTSIKEIRATCATLDINPEKFIKESTGVVTKQTEQQLQEAKTARDLNNVVLTLFYRDAETVAVVDKNIESSIGKSIAEQFASKTSDVALKLSMDLALLGQSSDPYLDLQRILTLLTIEKRQAEKRAVPLSTAENIHIQRMKDALDAAAKELENSLKFPGENEGAQGLEAFYSNLRKAHEHFADLHDAKPWWIRNQSAIWGIAITLAVLGAIYIFQDKDYPGLYWATAIIAGAVLYRYGEENRRYYDQRLRTTAINNYQTIAEKRAIARSARLKK